MANETSSGSSTDDLTGIWLDVADVRYDTSVDDCFVRLEADRSRSRPIYWPVDKGVLSVPPLEIYRTVLREIDRDRRVLARLACTGGGALHCDALRFQSADSSRRGR